MSTQSYQRFCRNRLVRGLPAATSGELYAAGEVFSAADGETIVAEGDDLLDLYILLAGTVDVFLPADGARPSRVALTRFHEGDCFGEYAFVDRRPASASISAAGTAELYRVSHRALQEFLDGQAGAAAVVYKNLLSVLVERLRASNAELDLFALPFSTDDDS